MSKVKIYTKSTCPACDLAKKILKDKGVSYEEQSLDNSPDEYSALKAKTGMQTVPQIFINNELIGGCSDLMQLDKDKKLDPMLSIQ